jgi:hypothetical protein
MIVVLRQAIFCRAISWNFGHFSKNLALRAVVLGSKAGVNRQTREKIKRKLLANWNFGMNLAAGDLLSRPLAVFWKGFYSSTFVELEMSLYFSRFSL